VSSSTQNSTEKERLALEIIKSLHAAIHFEVEHLYINAIGKTGDFASYIARRSRDALNLFPRSPKWETIKSLTERYAFLDLSSRMAITKKINAALIELEHFYKDEIERKNPSSENTKIKEQDELAPADPSIDISELKIQYLKGIGPYMAEKLKKLGVESCEDLLNYLPRTHISYSDVTAIKDLEIDTDVTVMGFIKNVTAFKSPRKNLIILTILVQDNTGRVKIQKFFQGNSTHYYLKQYKGQLPIGASVLIVGRVKQDKFSKQKVLQDQGIEVISEDFSEEDRSEHAHIAKIVPIYPLTEGVSLMKLRKIIFQTLKIYKGNLHEFIPEKVLEANKLVKYSEAIEEVHFPTSLETKNQAVTRLLFSEFFLMQLRFMQIRHQHKNKNTGIKFNCFEDGLVDKFIEKLPFKLTYAQKRVFFNEILPDMVSRQPMHRLLQGDVGSGKTVVAFLAALVAVADGYQAAIMVPTEILAEQHYKKFVEWVELMEESLSIKIGLLIGKLRVKQKREVNAAIKDGSINIVVGTHALIQDSVEYKRLGLIVIDEQHRFGVKQRDQLARKAQESSPDDLQLNLGSKIKEGEDKQHLNTSVEKLFMTATPIPRTLALAMHGDLDMSEIDEMPAGRIPIDTRVVNKKSDAHKLIKQELDKGNQAYIVFPLIDESEALAAKAATVEYEKLQKTVFKDYKMGLIHGKLKVEEKESVMEEFRLGHYDILVSTTVIEVGVDVPNATVMLIESAERFGLAQLHQLRGRVGRSDKQSYCLLSSGSTSQMSRARLQILEKTNNGFIIAQEDLKIRGSGDIIGLKQSGVPESALQGLIDQEDVLIHARNSAKQVIEEDPDLSNNPDLKKKLLKSAYTEHYNAG
jgi:ATP-dependent DNA helicase RecG